MQLDDTLPTSPLLGPPINRDELDVQLSPSRSSRHVPGVFDTWRRLSAAARDDAQMQKHLDLAYGDKPRQRYDVFADRGTQRGDLRPVHVFIHGGFWQEGEKEDFHFPARAFVSAGWIYVALGYTLAPNASLTEIVREVQDAFLCIKGHIGELGGDPDRIVVSGHSAGGHLAACLVSETASAGLEARPAGVVAISGVFDLLPISASYVNDAVALTIAEIRELSPAFSSPQEDLSVAIAVGVLESDEFIRQSRYLAEAWRPHQARTSYTTIPDADHFSVLFGLADPSSQLFRLITDLFIKKTGEISK